MRATVKTPLSVRSSPQGYFVAFLLGTFYSALFFYLRLDPVGTALFIICWVVIPFLALRDRVTFDGKRLRRTGLVPRVWNYLNGNLPAIRVRSVDQVQSEAIRTIRRGGNVVYRYRTVLRTRDDSVAISSGGSDYRTFIKELLSAIPEPVLDTRSVELRDYLADPKETLMRAEFSRIPSADVLESTLRISSPRTRSPLPSDVADEKLDDLHSLANELRISGYLLQAVEAFRRALVLSPTNARILFDFARCLHSLAGITRDEKLERRALAALRLSERHAQDDDILVRLGEWYFQIGDWPRSARMFRRAFDRFGASFRSARGLAEIALTEGKLAHVIHQFSAATDHADNGTQRRWSRGEAEYFSHLNSSDEYMDLELGRVNLLDKIEGTKKTLLKIALAGFAPILVGVWTEDALTAQAGWAITSIALILWAAAIVGVRLLSRRLPFDQAVKEH